MREVVWLVLVGVAAAACSSEEPEFLGVVCPKQEYIHCVDGEACPEPLLWRDGFVHHLSVIDGGIAWIESGESGTVYTYRDGNVEPVANGPIIDLWTSTGFFYLVEQNAGHSRSIVRVDVDGSAREVLVESFDTSVEPWAGQKWLTWVSGGDLWVMNLLDGSRQVIASVSNGVGVIRSDSDAVYWTEGVEDGGGARLMRYSPVDGAEPFWEGDSSREIFIRPDAVYVRTNRDFIRIDKKTGAESTIVEEDPIIHSVRMVGDKLYYWNINDGGLYQQDLSGGDPRRLFTIESGGSDALAVTETAAYMGFGSHCDIYRVAL
ncbi:MAG TPA: hypothetical protein VFG83_19235 [Kofleriaceae bacterium]|nr:hypothetical protein [Kofleriaceae bacterium]